MWKPLGRDTQFYISQSETLPLCAWISFHFLFIPKILAFIWLVCHRSISNIQQSVDNAITGPIQQLLPSHR